MAKKQKASPYDSSAGRGTGDYLAQPAQTVVEQEIPVRAMPMPGAAKGMASSPPDSTLFGAVLATLFCFAPFGVLAIIYALQVRPRWKRGDESGARRSAEMAEKLTFASVGIFVILLAIGAVWYVVYWFIGPRTRP